MGRKTDLMTTQVIGEINLTPLMDLTFILLITFIITFPLLESAMPVSLPRAEGTPIDEDDPITVTVSAEGEWYIDRRELTREQFEAEVRYIRDNRPGAVILLRGDEGLQYGRLVEVMHVLRSNGIQRISLVTQSGGT